MPYQSKAQERYFNANRSKLERQGVNVDEWNKASKGRKLPARAKKKKAYKRIVDNKMRWYGDTDTEKRVIRVNKKRSKTKPTHKRRYPEVLDTITHEEMHAQHPKMTERRVRIETRNRLKRMSENKKHKLYSRYA